MPGSIVHLIVQQRLAGALIRTGPRGKELGRLLRKDPCSPYAAFGSIGPDFLFFSLKEYGTPLDELVNFTFGVYDALEPLIDFYEEHIEPVEEALEDAVEAVDQALFQGIFTDLKATADLLSTTALTAVGTVVTGHVDLFFPFFPKIQQGAPEKEWYWFDFLHYRRTGRFASEMWKLAQGDDDLMRYVLGYVSHIGADVVGHPFVNAVTGGPFRTHWHRHKLVENWIDAYARNRYRDLKHTRACLRLDPEEDVYVPNAISGSYYYRLVEFPEGKLPPKLAELLVKAMANTYDGIDHPVPMTAADLDTTYRLWLKWFERSTTIGSARKPTPVPPPGSATVALITDYTSGFPPFPGGGGVPSPGGLADILAAILAFVKWLADTLSYTFDWIINHAADILLLPVTEALATLKWFIYQIRKAIYEIYDNLRFILVLGAYIFPEPQDLLKNPWGKALLNTKFAHLTGGATADFFQYPRSQEAHVAVGTTEHHLVYPATVREKEHAEPAPIPFHGVFPEAFISQVWPYDPVIEALYDCETPYGGSLKATHVVDQRTWKTPQFGNAIDFTARLITQRLDDLPNFNLDGDRGYGWKTWDSPDITDDPAVVEANPQVDATYIDA